MTRPAALAASLALALALPGAATSQSCAARPAYRAPAPAHHGYNFALGRHGYGHQGYGYGHHDAAFYPIAVFTPVPLFTVSNHHPQPGPAQTVEAAPPRASSELQQVLHAVEGVGVQVKSLTERVERLEKAQDDPVVPPSKPQSPPPPAKPEKQQSKAPPADRPPGDAARGRQVMLGRCASCHDKGVAAAKGGGVPLFDKSEVLRLSGDVKADVLTALYEDRMPKKGGGRKPLTDPEMDDVVAFVRTLGK